jgi:hypothetical protein
MGQTGMDVSGASILAGTPVGGYPWNVLTCAYAAGGGHLEVLQWARANGCDWNKWALLVCGE